MGIFDSLTIAIAGPEAVRRSQERGLERKYSHVAESLKSVTSALPEPSPQASPDQKIAIPRSYPASIKSNRTESDSLLSMRPHLYRSQSEIPKSNHPPRQHLQPPDITTWELAREQTKSTSSQSDVWKAKDGLMPPLPELKGFGKYRASVNADKQWHLDAVKRSMSNLDLLVRDLDNLSPGLTDDEWEQCKEEQLTRRGSAITSKSTGSDSSCGTEFIIDGTRVSHGFSPSTLSSTSSSFREDRTNFRKDSNLSVTSLGSKYRGNVAIEGFHRSATQNHQNNVSRFAALRRVQSEMQPPLKKIEKPCEFGASGDSESALTSDTSDIEDEEDAGWTDAIELPLCKESKFSKILHEQQQGKPQLQVARIRATSDGRSRRRATTKTAIDRSKTIRANSSVRPKRRSARYADPVAQKSTCDTKMDDISSQNNIAAKRAFDSDEASIHQVIHLPPQVDGDNNLSAQRNHAAGGQSDTNYETSATSKTTESSHQGYTPVPKPERPLRYRRNRSSTTVRITAAGKPLLITGSTVQD